MIDGFLEKRLRRVAQREQWNLLAWRLAATWLVAAALALGASWIAGRVGWASVMTLPIVAALTAAVASAWVIRAFVAQPEYRPLAERIERRHPDLRGLLLTAVQQPREHGSEIGYLQSRLVEQAVRHSVERDWLAVVPRWRLVAGYAFQTAALLMLGVSLITLHSLGRRDAGPVPTILADGLTVSPGDVEIERGDTLVVVASFGGRVPAGVEMTIAQANVPRRTVPLVKSLADPVFGGTVSDVATPFTYQIVHGVERSPVYTVTVFEHPRLVRSDATLTYPNYTGLEKRRIEDTRRISAVEGTAVELKLQLNKPVASARLVPRKTDGAAVSLATESGRAVATVSAWTPGRSQTYDLELVDADGRKNRLATSFVIDVQPNRRPELRLVAPRGDVRPSAIEEVRFEGTVWDDFGSPRYGIAFSHAGSYSREIELGRDLKARERMTFQHLFALEDMGAKPDELISWHVWADDIGPDGKVRRTRSDLYFAEVRPFDEIYRENSGMAGGESEEQGGDQPGGGAQRLTDLQKQIIAATWKLQRETERATLADDTKVVRDSQVEALGQARAAAERVTAPRMAALWESVTTAMETAAGSLNDALGEPRRLTEALASEQAALQALLKLQQRETNVTRSRSRRGGQGGEQGNQRQIDQLDLAQTENRYETRRDAQAPANTERREQLQVMNRLQELARRQQEVNERLKELQTALQEARTEKEREDVRRELKRLEEEQREMLAGVDELQQRMERPENQSRLAEERRQLEQTRQDLQRAAEAAGEGALAQAVAAGTRAQRQLHEMREQLRKENSNQFSDELRDLRGEAREIAEAQAGIGEQLNQLDQSQRKSLSAAPESEAVTRDLLKQQQRVQELMERATQLSSQAETSEPLLSRELYDSLRKVNQDDASAAKALRRDLMDSGRMTRALYDRLRAGTGLEGTRMFDLSADLLKEGYLPQAREAERKAGAAVDELRRGVERAAERVLGNDAEALRLAQGELEAITEQLSREAEQGQRQGQAQGQGQDQGQELDQGQAGVGEPNASGPRGRQASDTSAGQPTEAQPGRATAQSQPQSQSQSKPQPGQGPIDLDSMLPGGEGEGRMAGGGRGGAGGGAGPITGDNFGEWTERLRDVEDVLDRPELRDAVAGARERARLLRQEYRHNGQKPDWAVVKAQILRPLVEVKNRIGTELSRLQSNDPLAPVDRDPVPARFAESVRKYYEELGKDN